MVEGANHRQQNRQNNAEILAVEFAFFGGVDKIMDQLGNEVRLAVIPPAKHPAREQLLVHLRELTTPTFCAVERLVHYPLPDSR